MNKKFIQVVYLIAALSLSLAACNSGNVGELNQITTEMVSANGTTETLVPTEIPPTETLVPTEAPPTETAIPTIKYGDSDHFINVGDLRRVYNLYIPVDLADEEAVTVVFVFHGYYKDAWKMRNLTKFNDIADREGFVVVYPNGKENSWNIGPGLHGYAAQTNVDEFTFVKTILSDLEVLLNIDNNQVYATGFSMGGGMVYRLACEMSDTFAAIASVGGLMGSDCEPERPVSVLEIHGLADELVPFYGGGPRNYPPVQTTINAWRAINGCGQPTTQKDEDTGTTHTIFSCQDGSTVELITVEEMGHYWPDFASETIWEFFTTHPMP